MAYPLTPLIPFTYMVLLDIGSKAIMFVTMLSNIGLYILPSSFRIGSKAIMFVTMLFYCLKSSSGSKTNLLLKVRLLVY